MQRHDSMHFIGNERTVTTVIWILVAVIFVLVFVLIPVKQQKMLKKDREAHKQFLENLKIGDRVVLSSGIYGLITKIEENVYQMEIARDVVIEVLPQTVVGKDLRTS